MMPITTNGLSRRGFGGALAALSASGAGGARAAEPAAPFADNLQSMAWWMRRTIGKTIPELMPYYQQVLGMPLVRAWEDYLVLLWCGEDQIFEVKTNDNPPRADSDPATADMIPVFRVHDLPRWQARMARFGYKPVRTTRSAWGQTQFYRGPDNLITGFELRSPTSPLPSDQKALAAWRQGPYVLPGMTPLPDSLHYMSRCIRQVADVAAVSRYYKEAFGLKSLGAEGASQLFALGDDTIFEVAPGGTAKPVPADRSALPDTFVLRIHDLDAQLAALPARGAQVKGTMIIMEETTRLSFVSDPEGWIMGIEERGLVRPRYIEDVEADLRWRAKRALNPALRQSALPPLPVVTDKCQPAVAGERCFTQ
jgi:predicted enzyme related to lactoylglutathione lyase